MSNNLNHYLQQYQASQLDALRTNALGRAEQPQHQRQHQPEARFNGTAQSSYSMTPQSHQRYTSQYHPQAQSQPQVRTQSQPHSYQATGSHNTLPNDNLNTIFKQFVETLNLLYFQQRQAVESLEKSDKCLETLASSVSSIRETADGLTKKLEAHDEILEKLERTSHSGDAVDVIKVLVGEMKAFKKTLGRSCDGDDGRTVLSRLDAVTFAVGELLERARDPEANRQWH